jgi:dTDP-4-amino-4,6-dideoxygalactose transaminase
MNHKIRLSKSSISHAEKNAVLKVLDNEYLGMGTEVNLFEQKLKAYLGTELDVVCVNTGTSALHIALSCLGLKEGDEVLVPSLTYVASFQAISATGAKPIACDVNENTLFIDVVDASNRITKKTKVIMPVHYASGSEEMDAVYQLAKKNNLRVVEDAAQAFGCERAGQFVGVQGDVICFSFDGIKNITSGEGGAVVSGDKDFIQKVQDARLLGVEKDTDNRYLGLRSWDFDVQAQGFRYHMSNIMAAIGIAQLERIDSFRVARQNIAKKYEAEFKKLDEVTVLALNFSNVLPHIFVIKANKRNELRNYLIKHNIECGIHYKPNHLLSKYFKNDSLPITDKVYEQILSLPCHFDLKEDEQYFVIEKIRDFYGK